MNRPKKRRKSKGAKARPNPASGPSDASDPDPEVRKPEPSGPWFKRRGARIALECLAIYIVAWLIFYWRQFLTPNMPGTDGYYHIKIAWVYLTEGIPSDGFRWAQFSMWRDHFYDKEFGFHVLLMPFAGGDLMWGAKVATVTYGAMVYPTFHAVLRLSRVRFALFWTAMFFGAGAYFGWRINVPRPQILSMSIALWAAYFVLQRSWKGTLIVGAIYALCYTAPVVMIA